MPAGTFREQLVRSGFTIIAEQRGVELVAGINGQFWALREGAHLERPANLEAFQAFDRPGWAQGAIALRIEPVADGATVVATETRVRCVDDRARRRFRIYWLAIRPFSGWLRRILLERIARVAEVRE
jgi:hypothetical protein